MQIPTVTGSQKQIIFYLSSFRFLLISQLTALFSHQDSHRIKEWLIDLENKEFISIIKDPKVRTKPYIICLDQKARYILEKDSDIDRNFLKRLYREKKSSQEFMQKLIFIADTYIYFLKTKERNSQIDFFTKQDLQGYDYFPRLMPDAYIDEKTKEGHHRYFLEFFEAGISAKKLRFLVSRYFKYYDNGSWQENTDNTPFPTVLLIFESQRKRWHIYHYAKSLLRKSLTDEMEIFLTTKDQIILSKKPTDIWQSVDTT